MSDWLPLARLRGQRRARSRLEALAASGGPVPPLLFAGPEGVGKRTAALGFAAALVCLSPDGGEPCGACSACRRIGEADHVTALRADAPATAPPRVYPDAGLVSVPPRRTRISVLQARDIALSLSQHPFELSRRIYIVDPAERMTPAGLNALLKTLEEPPDFGVLILVTTVPAALPITVRSRLQLVRFGPLEHEDLIEVLDAKGLPREEAVARARVAEGSPGRALAADLDRLQQTASVWERALLRLDRGEPPGAVAIEAAQHLGGSAEEAEAALRFLLGMLRDALREPESALGRTAARLAGPLLRPIDTVERLRYELVAINRNPRLAVEGAVLALAGRLPERISSL